MKNFSRLTGCLALAALSACTPSADTETATPIFEFTNRCADGVLQCLVSLEVPQGPSIAPDGGAVAFTIRKADWENNRYDREIYLSHNGKVIQLTDNPDGSSADASWSPDGKLIAFRASTNNGAQLFTVNGDGSDKRQVTDLEGGVSEYVWSPDSTRFALKLSDRPTQASEAAEERYGTFSFAGDYSDRDHLWLLDLEKASAAKEPVACRRENDCARNLTLKRLTGGSDFTVGSFFGGSFTFTPDGQEVLFDHAKSGSPFDLGTQDISAVHVETGVIRPIVRRPGIDLGPRVSPDGKQVAFHMGEPPYYYTRQYWIALTSIDGGPIERVTEGVPNEASVYDWYGENLLFLSHLGVESNVYRLDTNTGEVSNLTAGRGRIRGVSIASDGKTIAFTAVDGENPVELYVRDANGSERKLTSFGSAIGDWPDTEVRLVQWTTPDGLELEGVLTLPAPEHRPDGPFPVLTISHGGPASTSRPKRVADEVYPTEYWLRKGAAIFEPNYRGSGSYTDELMAANVRRMGEGYTIDVESGLDHLVEMGIADPDKLGAMGWSAGGSVTAALAVRTNRFKALSVGAGISDYATYYALSDQPASPLAYLEATPWDDPAIYARAGAMAHVKNAVTPTLIQHGRGDGRVPFANGLQLYRGLKDAGVETELVIFENTGHVISRPKERLAALEQNVRWFDNYLFQDRESPDLDLIAK